MIKRASTGTLFRKRRQKKIYFSLINGTRVLKEPANSVAKPFFIIFEKSHQLGKITRKREISPPF